MTARAVLALFHAESDGDVLGSKAITVTKPDGSALGVSLYGQATGGAADPSPETNSVGTKLLYADYADLDAAGIGRVKVSYADAPATTFDDAFWPDPADLFVDGMERARSLGGALAVTGALTGGGGGPALLSGGASISGEVGLTSSISHASNWAGRFKNANAANGTSLLVEDPEGGLDVFKVRRSAAGRNIVVSNQQNSGLPTQSFWLIADEPDETTFITLDAVTSSTGTGKDHGAIRGVADQRDSGGNNLIRGLEGRAIRLAPAAAGGTWGCELNVTTDVPGSGPTYNVGLYVNAGSNLAGEVRCDSGIRIGGPAGWKDYLYCANTAEVMQFRVASGSESPDGAGDVITVGNLVSQNAGADFRIGVVNHDSAPAGLTYGGLNYDAATNVNALILGALTGGVGYRALLLNPNAGNVGIGVSAAQLAAGVGGAGAGNLPSTLYVDGTIAAAGLANSANLVTTGIISPTQLAANTDNWNPTGLATAQVIRASTDASRNLTGIVAQAAGTELAIWNVGAFDLVLVHDATSTAANRFTLPGAANLTLTPGSSIRLAYDGASSRWRKAA